MEHTDLPAGSEGDGHSVTEDIQLEVPEPCIPPSQFEKYHTKVYPGAARTYGKGSTFMDEFDDDEHVATREDNLYYPWASRNLLHFCYAHHSAWLPSTNSFL